MPPQRKYITEFGLTVDLDRMALISPRGLHSPTPSANEEYANGLHLYLIGRRPKTLINNPENIRVGNERLSMQFISYQNSEDAIVEVEFGIPGITENLRAVTKWPHDRIEFVNQSGETVSEFYASILLAMAVSLSPSLEQRRSTDEQFLDLEVEYVGKAFGASGDRGALDRLREHSTLQRIIGETSADAEVWIVLLDSSRYSLLTSIVPSGDAGDEQDLEDNRHVASLVGPTPDKVIVDLVEGALISYFKPRYNVQLKKSFPSPSSKPLAELYARDFNSIGFSVDTSRLSMRLKSSAVPPSFQHSDLKPLHNVRNRKAMLDFVDDIDRLRSERAHRAEGL